jgi:hypothetical protein
VVALVGPVVATLSLPASLPARLDARCAFGTSIRAGQAATSPRASWGALAVSRRAVLHSLACAALGGSAALLPLTPRTLFVAWTCGFALCHCWPG